MNSITLEQLRSTVNAGGVKDITLKAQGNGFFMEINTRSGQEMFLAKARSTEPRRFGNPVSALMLLKELGIAITKLDATLWNPQQKDIANSRPTRAQAMKEAHKAAAYNKWLESELQSALDDPRPSVSHSTVMAKLAKAVSTTPEAKKSH